VDVQPARSHGPDRPPAREGVERAQQAPPVADADVVALA
jgi:hypothetical protein